MNFATSATVRHTLRRWAAEAESARQAYEREAGEALGEQQSVLRHLVRNGVLTVEQARSRLRAHTTRSRP